MRASPVNIGNGDNEGYNYPEVAKHSYFIMPQFVQGHQKGWFQLSAKSVQIVQICTNLQQPKTPPFYVGDSISKLQMQVAS
jgi:hypothetical protein